MDEVQCGLVAYTYCCCSCPTSYSHRKSATMLNRRIGLRNLLGSLHGIKENTVAILNSLAVDVREYPLWMRLRTDRIREEREYEVQSWSLSNVMLWLYLSLQSVSHMLFALFFSYTNTKDKVRSLLLVTFSMCALFDVNSDHLCSLLLRLILCSSI